MECGFHESREGVIVAWTRLSTWKTNSPSLGRFSEVHADYLPAAPHHHAESVASENEKIYVHLFAIDFPNHEHAIKFRPHLCQRQRR
jgi:hypothetical protein